MFSKLSAFTALTFTLFAAAYPTGNDGGPSNQCNSGSQYCCNTLAPAGSSAIAGIPVIGAILQNLNVPVGITCTSINVIGVGGGGSCNQQQVCCSGQNYNGIAVANCSPINVNV